jgi:hypothetical protein
MDTVKAAFGKYPADASPEEQAAVLFFYKNAVTTLESAVTTDAMCGKSVMEALDEKTDIMKRQEEAAKLKQKEEEGMKEGEREVKKGATIDPNVWVTTMATAALLLDKETGASDTLSIVHNITSDAEQGKKRPKQFNNGKASLRGRIYMQYYDYFMLM